MKPEILSSPTPITLFQISSLINNSKIDPVIAGIDLEMVKMKLRDVEEGPGWTTEYCDQAEIEYKRFLHLNKRFPEHPIVPNRTMDLIWHQHILDTRAYQNDCETVFGEFFHHFPYFGMRSESDKQDLLSAFSETQRLYEKEFGEKMTRENMSKCNSKCNSSGKCKS